MDFKSIVMLCRWKFRLEVMRFAVKHISNRTGASPGTIFTVSGTARMVPAEVQTMLIGSKRNYSDSIKRKDST